jgi:hypothetical protein
MLAEQGWIGLLIEIETKGSERTDSAEMITATAAHHARDVRSKPRWQGGTRHKQMRRDGTTQPPLNRRRWALRMEDVFTF